MNITEVEPKRSRLLILKPAIEHNPEPVTPTFHCLIDILSQLH